MSLFTHFLKTYACLKCSEREFFTRGITHFEFCEKCAQEYRLHVLEDFKRVKRRGER